MSDPRRNAEHYMDMTAYLAIQNAEREMGMLPKNGEVWNVCYKGEDRVVIVMSAHDEYYTVLPLNDERRSKDDVAVDVCGIMYTTPGMLAYRYNNVFQSRVRTLSVDEFADLRGYVAEDLGIKADVASLRQQIAMLEHGEQEYEMVIAKLQDQIRDLNCELESHRRSLLVSSDAAMAALQMGRDVYKEAYHAIIDKLTERR